MYESIYAPDYYVLEHHGIKGQKWGVRRYQNSDGSLTETGKKRYLNSDQTWFNSAGQVRIDHAHARLRHPVATDVASAVGGAIGARTGVSASVLMAMNAGLITAANVPLASAAMISAPFAGAVAGYLLGERTLRKDSAFATKNWMYDRKMEAKTE